MKQVDRDVDSLWDLHRSHGHLAGRSFMTSNCKRFYHRDESFEDPNDLWRGIEELLAEFYRDENVGSNYATLACHFASKLRKDVDSNNSTALSPGVAALAGSSTWQATRAWTSTIKDPAKGREWCGILNQVAREDKKDLVRKSSRIQATMAGFSVKDRNKAAPPVAWPAATKDGEEAWTLFRGGRLPHEHRAWYQQHTSKQIRVPMNLATTKIKDTALGFMNNYSYPESAPKVLFQFKLDPHERCDHVNCLESLTLVPAEQEFLFPPYSCFTIVSVEVQGAITLITMKVEPNNKACPEDIPVAPWN